VEHTGQEPGGNLWEFFKFWCFLQPKSVNMSVTASPLDPAEGSPPDPLGYSLLWK